MTGFQNTIWLSQTYIEMPQPKTSVNLTTVGFHRGNMLWCGLDFAQQASNTLHGHKVQSQFSHLRGAQGWVSATGQQPPQSSGVESKGKVWLSPLCWHSAHEEGKEA